MVKNFLRRGGRGGFGGSHRGGRPSRRGQQKYY